MIFFDWFACGVPAAAPDGLQGTDADGALAFEDGELVLDAEAKRAFDYVLLADGEVDDLEAWFRMRLEAADYGTPEIGRVLDAFADYRRYRSEAARLLAEGDAPPDDVRRRLDRLVDDTLGDSELARLESARLDRAFALREAMAEADPEARRARVQALVAPASADFRATAGGRFLEARAQVEAARRDGASADDLRDVRRSAYAAFGPEAVARLEASRAARADFEARIAALAEEIDGDSLEAIDESALDGRFSDAERSRVQGALDRHRARR